MGWIEGHHERDLSRRTGTLSGEVWKPLGFRHDRQARLQPYGPNAGYAVRCKQSAKRLGQLFDYAIRQGWRADNPVKAVKAVKNKSTGFKTWQEEDIIQFERHHALGTTARLAFDLALYTAQRKSDVRIMGPQHVKNGWIKVKQLKTGKELEIPIHPNLAASIAATKIDNLAFIVSSNGKPFTYDSFGMWFMRQCRAAGIEGLAMHGLRKAASRRMAEQGLSNQLIKSITGHTSDSEVARYTREAEQVRMAGMAGEAMANPRRASLANADQTNGKQG
jgi:integrase